MIGNFGEVLVVDWGLAKVLNSDGVVSGDEEEGFVETDRSRNDSHLTQAGTVAVRLAIWRQNKHSETQTNLEPR